MDEFDTVPVVVEPEFQVAETEEAEEGFPSFRYGPDGQAVLCRSKADVPAGFKDHPSKVPGAPDPSLVVSERRLPRAELMAILKARGVDFKQTMGGGQLAKLVADSDEKEAAKAKMAYVRAAIKPKKLKVKKPSKAARSGK
jgi:hypothetical protein